LVVLEAQHKRFPDSEFLVTMDDVASYERMNGAVPRGAIVLLASAKQDATPLLNDDALRFLGEARNIVGIGTAAHQTVAPGDNSYLAAKGIYQLLNVTNIAILPRSGAIAIAAPEKVSGATEERSRVLALAR
jgi:kynurenine formamidase